MLCNCEGKEKKIQLFGQVARFVTAFTFEISPNRIVRCLHLLHIFFSWSMRGEFFVTFVSVRSDKIGTISNKKIMPFLYKKASWLGAALEQSQIKRNK